MPRYTESHLYALSTLAPLAFLPSCHIRTVRGVQVEGELVLNGTISVDGETKGSSTGAAGGSLWIEAGVLSGAGGSVSAVGGGGYAPANGYWYSNGGGGGGGRIALYCGESRCAALPPCPCTVARMI